MAAAALSRRRMPWKPTAVQSKVARQLAQEVGALVRTYDDGTAELRRIEGGALHRYLIDRDGSVEYIEAGPVSPRDAQADSLIHVAFWLSVAGSLLLILGGMADSPPWHPAAGAVGLALALGVGCVGAVIAPGASAPPGERWKYLFPSGGD